MHDDPGNPGVPEDAPRDGTSGVPEATAGDGIPGGQGAALGDVARARLIGGRYRLHGQIGRGAMGVVWRGRDELLARDVAVKEILVTAHAYPDVVYKRTLREARTAGRLRHPGVATVFDVVEEDGSLWIVMELISARSLDRIIAEDGPLPPLRAAEVGASLVSALVAAHAAGVLHRDVKPSNVLVTSDDKAVLTDFGLATFAADPAVTQVGMVVGTPGFTAPERVRGNPATPASDMWSVGATLYAAVEGRGPFDRIGDSAVIMASVASEDAPRAPSAGRLAPVIEALLSRDPAARPDAAAATRLLTDTITAGRKPAAGQSAAGQTETRLAEAGLAEAGLAEAGLAAAGLAEAGLAEAGLAEAGLAEAGLAEAGLAEAGLAEAGLAAAAPSATGMAQSDRADRQADGSPQSGSGPVAGPGGAAHGRFLDPPVFSELVMPDVSGLDDAASGGGAKLDAAAALVTWPAAGDPVAGRQAAGGSGRSGYAWSAATRDAVLSSGRWRVIAAMAGIACLGIAAAIGWGIYTISPSVRSAQGTLQQGVAIASHFPAPGGHSHVSRNSSPLGKPSATAGSSGSHRGGKPGPEPSSKPTPHSTGTVPIAGQPACSSTSAAEILGGTASPAPSPSSSQSPTPSASPSPSSSPSPSPTPSLPAGYRWHRYTAALLSTTAGFEIAVPKPWTQKVTPPLVQLNQSRRHLHVIICLATWRETGAVREARYMQERAAHSYRAYKKLLLRAISFKSVGYTSVPAAELKFGFTNAASGVRSTELIVLVKLPTKPQDQTYSLTVWAPRASFPAAERIFLTALKTFRPILAG
jgi:hypothetical protein